MISYTTCNEVSESHAGRRRLTVRCVPALDSAADSDDLPVDAVEAIDDTVDAIDNCNFPTPTAARFCSGTVLATPDFTS